jgi:antitoxin YobK
VSMDDLERFLRLVEEYESDADFVGPRDERLIETAEERLGLSFPPTYRRFVLELGAGDIAGQEFFGVIEAPFADPSVPNGVWMTLKARDEWTLPRSMLVIAFSGGVDYYVIDTAKATPDREPAVEIWRPGISLPGDPLEQMATDFGAFALELATEGLGVA